MSAVWVQDQTADDRPLARKFCLRVMGQLGIAGFDKQGSVTILPGPKGLKICWLEGPTRSQLLDEFGATFSWVYVTSDLQRLYRPATWAAAVLSAVQNVEARDAYALLLVRQRIMENLANTDLRAAMAGPFDRAQTIALVRDANVDPETPITIWSEAAEAIFQAALSAQTNSGDRDDA